MNYKCANLLAATVLFFVGVLIQQARAVTVSAGDVIQMSFWDFSGTGGGDSELNNWNTFNNFFSNENGTQGLIGSTTQMMDSNGNILDVFMTNTDWSVGTGGGGNNTNIWVGDGLNAAGPGHTVNFDQSQGWWWNFGGATDPSVTIHGLNPALTYNVDYYWTLDEPTFGDPLETRSVDVNGTTIGGGTRGGDWANTDTIYRFTGIASGGVGGDELTITSISQLTTGVRNPTVHAIVITAVPEPSTMILVGLACASLVIGGRRSR